jgi:uncharacterized protein
MANRLQFESSPYLLQHANNPVDWYPYGDEAFDKALAENKPLLFSIGYSACHWCHVMEQESFENEAIARIMNELFVCVKVDREERPDVDHFYMDAVQLLYGHGGWPLNCFTLPDGRPFWGGTYFKPEQWQEILLNVSGLFKTHYDDFEEQAAEVTTGIINHCAIQSSTERKKFGEAYFTELYYYLSQQFDQRRGGMSGSPKFPMPMVLQSLLHYYFTFSKQEALDHVMLSLRKMARGGIYDQVGGGFARYSIDNNWKVPHFEKMLYDNAQLVSLYSNTYKINKDDELKDVIESTLAFVKRELTSPEGVFYSSLDADSEGEEGLFYTWTEQEFKEVLVPYGELMAEYFGIGLFGVWENGKNILLRPFEDSTFAKEHFLSEAELKSLLQASRLSLLEARSKRVRPGMDDKILVSWNALMIKAYLDAYAALDKAEYLETAIKAVEFILKELKTPKGGLLHTWKNGIARIPAFLDDYSFLAESLLVLYQCTMNPRWLAEAEKIAGYIQTHFTDAKSGMFFFSEEEYHNVIRKVETHDSVVPSSNSSLARMFHILGTITGTSDYIGTSRQMLEKMNYSVLNHPLISANWACLAMEVGLVQHVIAIVGNEADERIKEINRHFLPNAVIIGSTSPSDAPYVKNRYVEGETLIHICVQDACFAPVETVDKAIQLLGAHQGIIN